MIHRLSSREFLLAYIFTRFLFIASLPRAISAFAAKFTSNLVSASEYAGVVILISATKVLSATNKAIFKLRGKK